MLDKGRLFTCVHLEDLGYKFEHCISCHSDFEEGYSYCERYDGDDTLIMCCSAAILFDCQDEREVWERLREVREE